MAGRADTASGQHHAFITGPNGVGMTDLGELDKLGDSWSYSINAAGQVVGYFGGQPHAFITGPNGVGMTDLNSLVIGLPSGVVLSEATAINNMGRVIALPLVNVVPEPQTYALMLAGLILTGVMVRRKQRG
ncbi:MAG: PEP-CTERM sorting domain-containing protein [Nitrosospira sp.]